MKVFLYSSQKSLASFDNQEVVIDKNPSEITLCGDVIRFFNGKNYEPSIYHKDAFFQENVAITDLYGAFLCYPILKPKFDLPYKTIVKRSFVFDNIEYLITVFTDGAIKLRINGYNEELILQLPFIPQDLKIYPVGGNLFLVDLISGIHYVAVFSAPTIKEEFSAVCHSYDVSKELSIKKIGRTIFSYEETSRYNYDGKVNLTDKTCRVFYPYKELPDKLLTYAFLEEVRLSVDYRHFLSDNLLSDYSLIKDFLGEYSFILPPFLKDFPSTYAVVGKTAKYVKTTVENNKITDILLEDYPF